MIDELKIPLDKDYKEDIYWQQQNQAEANQAKQNGDLEKFFSLSLNLRLPDTCWALGRWDEARRWYQHNARIYLERRSWLETQGDPDNLLNELIDWEATTLIKAGNLKKGPLFLEQAINYWQRQPDPELILSQLGLHAAQVGASHLAHHALSIIPARKALTSGGGKSAKKIRELLHYEPAQTALLMEKWHELEQYLAGLEEAEALLKSQSLFVFPPALQEALLAATHGLRILAALQAGQTDPETGQAGAKEAFEKAMVRFYKFGGDTDWNVYFMRLNIFLAEELAAGRPLQPNPFADDG